MFSACASSISRNFRTDHHYQNPTQASESDLLHDEIHLHSDEFHQKIKALLSLSRPAATRAQIQKSSVNVTHSLASSNTINTNVFFNKDPDAAPKDPWSNTWDISYIRDVRHLKDCLNADIPDEIRKCWENPKKQLMELALTLPTVFEKQNKDGSQVKELIELTAIQDINLYRKIISTAEKACHSSLVDLPVIRGIGLIVQNCPVKLLIDAEKTGDLVRLLKIFQKHLINLCKIKKSGNVSEEALQIVLQTLCQLLDTMFLVGVTVDREKIQEQLDYALSQLHTIYKNQKNHTLAWQISYARQALKHLSNNESIRQYWKRQVMATPHAAFLLLLFIGHNKDLLLAKSFIDAVSHDGSLFGGAIAKLQPLSMELYKWRESASIERWYVTLRFTDLLIEAGALIALEKFVYSSEDAKDKNFLLGFCLRLEQIICTQKTVDLQCAAIQFLGDLAKNHGQWGNHKEVKDMVKSVLIRLKKERLCEASLHAVETILQDEFQGQEPLAESTASSTTAFFGNADLESSPNTLLGLARKKILNKNNNLNALKDIDSNITILGKAYLKTLEKTSYLKDALKQYVELEAIYTQDGSTRYGLDQIVENFLEHEKTRVLLLLGKAGSGKSTSCHYVVDQLWQNYFRTEQQNIWHQTPRIPVFIDLTTLGYPVAQDAITEGLKKQGFPDLYIPSLKNTRRLVFILDGYNEVAKSYPRFYEAILFNQWKDAKFIITARPQGLKHPYASQLVPLEQLDALQKAEITPFSDRAVEAYIENYAANNPFVLWNAKKYRSKLEYIPALNAQKHHPFSLQIALDLLPALDEAGLPFVQQDIPVPINQPISQIARYDRFMRAWISHSHDSFDRVELSEEDRRFFVKQKKYYDIDIIKLSQDFAVELYKHNKLDASYDSASAEDQSWLEPFLGPSIQAQIFRLSAPLMDEDGIYRFIHPSIQDYLVSCAICGPVFTSKTFDADRILNKYSFINQPKILDFLVERVKQHSEFKKYLHRWITASKETTARIQHGAANAITVLVRAGEVFNAKDLKSISIPFANLERGAFDGTEFDQADLTGVKFSGAWLRGTSFNRAEMGQIEFGDGPAISSVKGVDFIEKIEISPNSYWLASYGPESILSLQSLTSTPTSLSLGKIGSKEWITFSPDDQWAAWQHTEGYIAYKNIMGKENKMYFKSALNEKCIFSSDNLDLIVPTLQKEKDPKALEEQRDLQKRCEEMEHVCLKLKTQHQALSVELDTLESQMKPDSERLHAGHKTIAILVFILSGSSDSTLIAGALLLRWVSESNEINQHKRKKEEKLALKNELTEKQIQLQVLYKQVLPKIKIQFLSLKSNTVDLESEIYTAGEITAIAFSTDRAFLFTAEKEAVNTEKTIIKKWDLKTGQLAERIYSCLPSNASEAAVDTPTSIQEIVPSPNGKCLAWVERNEEAIPSTIRLFALDALETTNCITMGAATPIKLSFSPNGLWLAAAQGNELVLISTKSRAGALERIQRDSAFGMIHAMCWQQDEALQGIETSHIDMEQQNRLLTIGSDHILHTWQVIDIEPQPLQLQLMRSAPQTGLRFAHMSIVGAESLSADNSDWLDQFNVQAKSVLDDMPDIPTAVHSPNGEWRALAEMDKKDMHPTKIILSSLETEATFQFELASSRAGPCAFSPNNQWLVVADATQLVLISTHSGAFQKTQEKESTTAIHAICWKTNDSVLTLGADRIVRTWEVIFPQTQDAFELWLVEPSSVESLASDLAFIEEMHGVDENVMGLFRWLQ